MVAQVLAGPWGGVGQRGRRGGSGAVAWLLCEDLLLASWLSVLGQVSCLCCASVCLSVTWGGGQSDPSWECEGIKRGPGQALTGQTVER